jgi:hypothetical protein
MAQQATYEDVNLILRLYEQRREEKMREARQWFAGMFKAKSVEEFQKTCPQGSGPNSYFRMVTTYWEMVASFITAGVLNEELFFQSGMELLLTWEKVKDLAPQMRESRKNQLLWKNLEIVAGRMAEYLDQNSPGSYPHFSEMVKGMAR